MGPMCETGDEDICCDKHQVLYGSVEVLLEVNCTPETIITLNVI